MKIPRIVITISDDMKREIHQSTNSMKEAAILVCFQISNIKMSAVVCKHIIPQFGWENYRIGIV